MNEDLYTLAGAYVLDALDAEERASFEAYLATSPEAQAEVDSLREVTALLGTAVAETPPQGLRRSVLDEIDTVRQQPPIVTSLADAPRRHARQAGPEWVLTLTRVAAAVAVIVAVGLGVVVTQLASRLDAVETTNQRVATLVTAEDAQQVAVALDDGGRISAVISSAHGSALVVGDQLADLQDDRMYALWRIHDGVASPVGELVEGHAVTVAADGLETLGVTIEPRGPLSTPTSDPIGVLSV